MKTLIVTFISFLNIGLAVAFPGIENFVGTYKYVSGPTGTIGCGDFEIKLNQTKDGLEVYYIDSVGDQYMSYDFPFVNAGVQPWKYDWGDGIATGDQIIGFDGAKVDKLIKIKENGIVVGEIYSAMYFEDYENLTIDSKSADSNTKCIVKKQ